MDGCCCRGPEAVAICNSQAAAAHPQRAAWCVSVGELR